MTERGAKFVWAADEAPRRNQFVRFVREFTLDELVQEEVRLHVFADTRYRLRLNGKFLAAGPARFVTQFPEFDSVVLNPALRAGDNVLEVEVNFFGASSFQSMPDGRPGFIAWGKCGDVDFSTPGAWRAERLHAWRTDSPLYSFAQNPVEICDTRLLGQGKPVAMRELVGEEAPWGELRPYSGRPILYFPQRPRRIELAGAVQVNEWRFGFMSQNPLHGEDATNGRTPRRSFATWLWSPENQTARISCFWSTLFLNGQEVETDLETPFGNHAYCTLALRAGWNLLAGHVELFSDYWAYCLGIPLGRGITAHGRRDKDCPFPLALSPVECEHVPELPQPGDSEAPEGWELHDGNPANLTPARIMAWDALEPDALRCLELPRMSEVSTFEAPAATWCFSFAGEFMGYVELDVEGPEGTIVDVATDDWQSPGGGVALYQSNPFTDSADRFLLRGGRQKISLFHPRGGKFLQVTMRSPGGRVPLSLHDLIVRSRQTPGPDTTRFSCDQPDLTWVWPVAMRTMIVATDEAYTDCPWRERGCYIGDSFVNLHLDLLMDHDYRTIRRVLRTFAQAQLPDGQLACCAPAWLRKPHEDFTLIWILSLHDFWALTGETELVNELWPTVQRIWQSPSWRMDQTGLWDTTGARLFVDWGIIPEERSGAANACINLFRFGALKASARLAAAIGRHSEAAEFLRAATDCERALFEVLWYDLEGRFLPSRGAGTPALHANVLALYFSVGSENHRRRILAYLEPRLRKNFSKGIREGQFSGHIELYFLHYLLPALAGHGRADLAELLIAQHYGFLRGIGDDTLPECFCRVQRAVGSRCHSWSGAAALYAARYVLGVRQAVPGDPSQMIFEPQVAGILRAEGRFAHPYGWFEVRWEKGREGIEAVLCTPPRVSVRAGEHVRMDCRCA